MHSEARAVKTALWFQLTARASAAPTPTTTDVAIGVPVRGDTFPSTRQNGSDRSRAIENIIREPDVCTASVQAKPPTPPPPTPTRPPPSPSRPVSTEASPPLASVPSVSDG